MPAALATWVRRYVAEASSDENVEAFVAFVNARILAALPEIADDPVLCAELHASTKSQFQVFLSLLERERQELLLPPQAVDLALSIARRGLELAVLLKVYRVASAAVWEAFTEVAESVPADGPDRTEVLVYLWDHGGTWINEASEQLIGVFYAEREAALHGALAQRSETVRALLRGDDVAVESATDLLAHPLRAHHVALVLWTGTDTAADLVDLTTAAEAIAASAETSVLTIPAGRGEVWAWLAQRRAPDPEALRGAIAVTADRAAAVSGVRIAIGVPAAGVDGFRSSHREAVDAQRHAVESGSAGVTWYGDVELACVAAGNEPGARALVARELGGLGGSDPALARVRETLATYLRLGGSVEQTAAELFVHKNTVRYRLAQAEELLGHPLAERRTEVALGLACLSRFGPSPAAP